MDEIKKLFNEVDTVELTEFERKYLIPTTIDKVKFFLESFKKIIPICDDQQNAMLIDAAVRQVISLPIEIASSPFPIVGNTYLQQVKSQVETEWIPGISAIVDEFPNAESVISGSDFYKLLQMTQSICSSISRSKNMIFKWQQRAFPIIINKATGEAIGGIPQAIEITSFPFEVILNDIENTASSLLETLRGWNRGRQERRKDYVAYLAAVAQVRSAQWLNLFQLAMIIFTIILTIFSSELVELVHGIWGALSCDPVEYMD